MQRKKQPVKNEPVYKSSEVMSMLEQLNDGIKVIGEQHGGIVKRLDSIDERLDSIDTRLDSMDTRLGHMEDDVVEIKHKLSEKVDREEFNKMEKRLVKLEKLVLAKLA